MRTVALQLHLDVHPFCFSSLANEAACFQNVGHGSGSWRSKKDCKLARQGGFVKGGCGQLPDSSWSCAVMSDCGPKAAIPWLVKLSFILRSFPRCRKLHRGAWHRLGKDEGRRLRFISSYNCLLSQICISRALAQDGPSTFGSSQSFLLLIACFLCSGLA
jgi:hypothetical protein